jgi:hypothetical protein
VSLAIALLCVLAALPAGAEEPAPAAAAPAMPTVAPAAGESGSLPGSEPGAGDESTGAAAPGETAAPGEVIEPPGSVVAEDTPGDDGSSLTIRWKPSGTEGITAYEVYRIDLSAAEPQRTLVARKRGQVFEHMDMDATGDVLVPGHEYRYEVVAVKGEQRSAPAASNTTTPVDEWFNPTASNINLLITTLIFCVAFPLFIWQARRGRDFFIRPIAGLSQIDDAIGRATEMGRPILFVPGIGSIQDIATIAALTILGRVARKAAEYNTPIEVPVCDYLVLPVARETVRTEFLAAGRPDAFRADSVYFVTTSQFAYVANICGTMKRIRPATNFLLGMFRAESLILAETGASTGAIQIAGTDSDTQLPFFITACDYTLIGEEFYAASAYLSREPVLMGTLKAQDFGKLLILLALILGTIATVLGYTFFFDWFPTR